MTTTHPVPRRGRPPQMPPAERETVILDAAERVLMSRGLQGMTMAAVAREAGMSKRTLYAVFEGREALFAALIRRVRSMIVTPLAKEQEALPLAERLGLLLGRRGHGVIGEAPLEVLRAAVAEARRHPDLAMRFLEEGPRTVRRLIRAELDRAVARGEIAIENTDEAASLLHDMVFPCPFEKLLARDLPRQGAEEMRARTERALALFLRGAAGPDEAG